jgi:hypothetical protein
MIGNLYIYGSPDSIFDLQEDSMIPDGIENAQWLELLRPFAAAKNLYLPDQFAPHIVPALKELVIGGRTIEVFPAIQNFFFFLGGAPTIGTRPERHSAVGCRATGHE